MKKEIFKCLPCQVTTDSLHKEAIKVSELPSGPWECLSMDFWGPTYNGEYLLVLIDNYSRFPEIEIVSSTSAKSTIPKLDKILSSMGIPSKIISDNGPPFNSIEMKEYSKRMGFYHHRITPLWPQANGMVENFMRSINKLVKTARVEGKNWKQQLFKFLRNFRATLHPTIGVSPASLLFQGRQVHSRLPEITKLYNDNDVRKRDADQKRKTKHHADKKMRLPKKQIDVGDQVLVRQKKVNKFSTRFKEIPYIVVKKNGSRIVAKNKFGHIITRNSSFFKLFEYKHPLIDDSDLYESANGYSDLDILPGINDNSLDSEFVVQPVNPDNSVNYDNSVNDNSVNSDIVGNSDRRYPQRDRRLPVAFNDYEM